MKALFEKFLYSNTFVFVVSVAITAVIVPAIMFLSTAMLSGALILH